MSCDSWTYHAAIAEPAPRLSATGELGDYAGNRNNRSDRGRSVQQNRPCLTADQSESKAHRHEHQSTIIPDSTQTEPEYVWGDEGPIND